VPLVKGADAKRSRVGFAPHVADSGAGRTHRLVVAPSTRLGGSRRKRVCPQLISTVHARSGDTRRRQEGSYPLLTYPFDLAFSSAAQWSRHSARSDVGSIFA
jgi:hypothetical protein